MTIPRSWRSGHAGRSTRPSALPQGRGRRSPSGSSRLPLGEHQEFRVDLANDPVAAVVIVGVEARVDSLDSMTDALVRYTPTETVMRPRFSPLERFINSLLITERRIWSATVSAWRKPGLGGKPPRRQLVHNPS